MAKSSGGNIKLSKFELVGEADVFRTLEKYKEGTIDRLIRQGGAVYARLLGKYSHYSARKLSKAANTKGDKIAKERHTMAIAKDVKERVLTHRELAWILSKKETMPNHKYFSKMVYGYGETNQTAKLRRFIDDNNITLNGSVGLRVLPGTRALDAYKADLQYKDPPYKIVVTNEKVKERIVKALAKSIGAAKSGFYKASLDLNPKVRGVPKKLAREYGTGFGWGKVVESGEKAMAVVYNKISQKREGSKEMAKKVAMEMLTKSAKQELKNMEKDLKTKRRDSFK